MSQTRYGRRSVVAIVCLAAHCCYAAVSLSSIGTSTPQSATDHYGVKNRMTQFPAQAAKPMRRPELQSSGNRQSGDSYLAEAVRLQTEWKAASLRMALQRCRAAATLFKEAADKRGEAQALMRTGELLAILGAQEDAPSEYRRALELSQSANDTKLQVDILNRLVEIGIDRPDIVYQLHAEQALDLAERIGYERGRAFALKNLGVIAYQRQDYPSAIDYFNRALSLSKLEGDLAGEAEALTNLGFTYGNSGEVNRAAGFLEQALAAAKAAGDLQKEARIGPFIALVFIARGQWQKALDLYHITILLLRQIGDDAGLAVALNGLGSLYNKLGEVNQSLANLNESLSLSRRMGHWGREALTLSHIADVYAENGHGQEALRIYHRLLVKTRASGNRSLEAHTLSDSGAVYESLGGLREALRCYDSALAIGKSLHNPRVQAYARARRGVVYVRMKKLKEAGAEYQAALSLMVETGDPSGEALVRYNIARLKQDQGDIDAALQDISGVIESVESQRADVISPDLRTSYSASVHRYYQLLINVLMQKNERDPASDNEVAGLEESEHARARSLAEMLSDARTSIREGVAPELLDRESVITHQLEKKAAEQMELRQKKFELTTTMPRRRENRAEQLAQAGQAIESLSREINELIAQLDQVRTEIAAARPKKHRNLLQSPRISIKQVQEKLLDDETLVLEYSVSEARSYLWAVGRDSLTSYPLPGRAEIERQARQFYEALTAISRAQTGTADSRRDRRERTNVRAFNSARRQLSLTLLGPITGIAGSKRLVIVADGALQYIPFAALSDPASNQPLLVAHEIVTLPSLSVLAELRDEIANRPSAPKTLAVFADPVVEEGDPDLGGKRAAQSRLTVRAGNTKRGSFVMEGERGPLSGSAESHGAVNFVRLPFAAEEAEMLERLLPEGERTVWKRFDANRETATSDRLNQFRMIHFAAHGLLDFQHPNLSCLVLSRFDRTGQKQDGYLRLQDVYNMRLSAELVVLSACQTALGKEVKGEGLMGLTRGFLYAGATRVVASLWNVDDNATAKLMEHFYGKMLGPEKLRPAAALRAAQIEMMSDKRWQDPYFWAGFVLHGEWR